MKYNEPPTTKTEYVVSDLVLLCMSVEISSE
jgi:hypothetical protein